MKNIILRVANTKNENTVIRIANQKEDFDTNTFEQKVIKTEKFKLLKNYRLETKDFEKDIAIKEKIERNTIKLESIFLVAYGVRVNNKTVSSKPKSFYVSENKKDGYKPFVEGRNIERYYFSQNGWLNYKPKEHYNPMFPELFENEKIMFIRIVSDRLRFAYDNNNTYNSHTVINCVRLDKLKNAKHISAKKAIKNADLELVQQYDTKFILAILNSSFINWYFLKFLSDGLNFYPDNAKNLPIPTATPEQQEKLASLAQIIIELKKKLAEAKVSNDKRLLTQQAEGIDKEIDKLVYQLYGLNDEEIKVIEEN
ncbi:MAG: TaqI-like C-terminal specificity domain-containing protein [Candidatus Kapaibacterium sp.]